jgi:hypothetical protein
MTTECPRESTVPIVLAPSGQTPPGTCNVFGCELFGYLRKLDQTGATRSVIWKRRGSGATRPVVALEKIVVVM